MDDDGIHVVEEDEIIEGEAFGNEDADFGSEDADDPDPTAEEDATIEDEVRENEAIDEGVEEGRWVVLVNKRITTNPWPISRKSYRRSSRRGRKHKPI